MELTPSSRNTMPTVMPMAATLTHGSIRQMKPASVKRMPTARIHPHARTPRARRSNELTHCDTPENSSHSVNRNGSDSIVNHWLKSRNSDMITVRIPSSNSQPEPSITPLAAANTTISATPDSNRNIPSSSPAESSATS